MYWAGSGGEDSRARAVWGQKEGSVKTQVKGVAMEGEVVSERDIGEKRGRTTSRNRGFNRTTHILDGLPLGFPPRQVLGLDDPPVLEPVQVRPVLYLLTGQGLVLDDIRQRILHSQARRLLGGELVPSSPKPHCRAGACFGGEKFGFFCFQFSLLTQQHKVYW